MCSPSETHRVSEDVPGNLRVLVCERDASRLVNAVFDLRTLFCCWPTGPRKQVSHRTPNRNVRWAFQPLGFDSLTVPSGTTRSLRGLAIPTALERDKKRALSRGTTPSRHEGWDTPKARPQNASRSAVRTRASLSLTPVETALPTGTAVGPVKRVTEAGSPTLSERVSVSRVG